MKSWLEDYGPAIMVTLVVGWIGFMAGRHSVPPVVQISEAKPTTADVCYVSKAKVELLKACEEAGSCIYTMENLRTVVLSVAQCEQAKVSKP